MKVIVKEACREAEKEFYKIPEEKRRNAIFFTCADLLPGKPYEVIALSKHGFYQIVDESGDWYSYPPLMFEIVEG